MSSNNKPFEFYSALKRTAGRRTKSIQNVLHQKQFYITEEQTRSCCSAAALRGIMKKTKIGFRLEKKFCDSHLRGIFQKCIEEGSRADGIKVIFQRKRFFNGNSRKKSVKPKSRAGKQPVGETSQEPKNEIVPKQAKVAEDCNGFMADARKSYVVSKPGSRCDKVKSETMKRVEADARRMLDMFSVEELQSLKHLILPSTSRE